MAEATAALLGSSLFANRNASDLTIVWDDWSQKPDSFRPSRSALQRVENILRPIVDIVNSESGQREIESNLNLDRILGQV